MTATLTPRPPVPASAAPLAAEAAPSCPTIPALGTILGVWAHPDDEAYLSAGLMSLARRHGQRVAVVSATAGGALRHRELAAALAAVGVEEHRVLGMTDGSLADVAPEQGASLVGAAIEQVRPDTIVTFGPDGLTGHPDHRAVSRWVSMAWEVAGRPARLWHATLSEGFHAHFGSLSDRMGVWMPGATPPRHRPEALATSIRCEGWLLDRKLAALAAHASQTTWLRAQVGEATYGRWWAEESFVEVAGDD